MHRSNEDWSRVVNGIGERHLLVVVMSDTLYLETDAGLRSIQLILTNKLNESGWTDDLRHQSKGTCGSHTLAPFDLTYTL
jgi:hypothetical protein